MTATKVDGHPSLNGNTVQLIMVDEKKRRLWSLYWLSRLLGHRLLFSSRIDASCRSHNILLFIITSSTSPFGLNQRSL
ncbi:unnamed protein product [Toxocara canis]|uniref:Uncharacterized protein n=1 Tax=Toxocara canis TaxID=6265 RepID=A0A183USL3_TOXCA|nr:unnamed protein product [Toxocara canis]